MKNKLELYIHIPFCVRKCKYCDFLSAPADSTTIDLYIRQLVDEIKTQSQFYEEYTVSSIFLGGGTPSILKSALVTNILSAIFATFKVEANAEVTIECNPGTVSSERLLNYKAAGINRLSFGLQSTNDSELKVLGRIHTYEDFLESFEAGRKAGFKNINVDLMSALPGQTVESWKKTLKSVAMLKPEHISAYSLQIEEGTPFFSMYGSEEGRKLLPDEDTDREMYHETRDILDSMGYHRYEISNYAREGFECRHNIGYWTGVEYLGIGLGASSYCMGRRFKVGSDLKTYIAQNFSKDLTYCYQDIQELSINDMMSEFMFLGLRMTNGVSSSEFYERFGQNLFDVFGYQISKNQKYDLLEVEVPYVRLTRKGLDLANTVMADFLL